SGCAISRARQSRCSWRRAGPPRGRRRSRGPGPANSAPPSRENALLTAFFRSLLAAELVKLKVDVIVAVPGAVEAARDATNTLPIVVPAILDPVESGLVSSLAHPGGNITGTASAGSELAGKHLELLKEAIPKLSRVAVLWTPATQVQPREMAEMQSAARLLGETLHPPHFNDPH